MPRIARDVLLFDGCYVHIISRAIRKERIMRDKEDFITFLSLLKAAKRQSGFQLFHYCIMHTHFHLAAMIPSVTAFSKSVQFIKSQYCFKYHTKYRINGPIWRERFKSLLIEDENYLRVCGEYIEYNPVKAGLVKEAKDWPYSSKQFYNTNKIDELTDGYGAVGDTYKMLDVSLDDEKYFEGGIVIGSPYFRHKTIKKLKTI